MKRQPMEWERVFANDAVNKDLISTTYKQLIQLNKNNKTNPIENGQKTLIGISPKKTYR